MANYQHAGMGWSNGPIAGGNGRILSLPSADLLLLGSEHWHHDEAVRAGKRVLFRGMARQGFRPAEVGWNVRRYVDEILRDAVRVSEPISDFVAWNELNLQDERGDHEPDHGDLNGLFSLLGQFTLGVIAELRRRPVTKSARLHFGAWAPKDETDYTRHWKDAADLADCVDVHAYGPGIIDHVGKYAALFPGKPIELTEWHSDLAGPDEDRRTLEHLAWYAAREPSFRAYYFLWKWFNPPSHQRDLADAIAVEGNPDRLHLFRNPPTAAAVPTPPPPIVEPAPVPPEPEVPTVDPWRYFSAEQIAAAVPADLAAVRENWPPVADHLERFGIYDQPTTVAALATIGVEVGAKFAPINEYGDDAYFERMYGPDTAVGAVLGNVNPGDGAKFHGRGLIQLTGRSNYQTYGQVLEVPLEDMPDEALHPIVSAAVLALYFRDHGVPALAAAGDWRGVRRAVNGGLNGWDRFVKTVVELGGVFDVPAPGPDGWGYSPSARVNQQPDQWSCAIESTAWLLRSIGRNPSREWLEATMVPAVVSRDVGLLDASGRGLAELLTREYGSEMGFETQYDPDISFDHVAEIAGWVPVLIGGRSWGAGGHWSGVRRVDENGWLDLANPVNGYTGVGTHLSRAEWDARGPWSAVWVATGEPVVVEPAPAPTDPRDARIAQLEAEVAEKSRRLDEVVSLLGVARGDYADQLETVTSALRALVPSS